MANWLSVRTLKLAFCPGAGAADNSCSSSSGGGHKFSEDTTKRVLLAAQASIKAKSETNFIKAAKLHGMAARANEKAAKAIQKDPSYGKIVGAQNLLSSHRAKELEHTKAAKQASEKLFGASAGLAKQRESNAKLLTDQATKATKIALGPKFGQNVKMYGSGDTHALNKTIAYATAHDAHVKASAAHSLAGNTEQAEYHSRSARQMEKEFEHYRSML